MTDLHFMPPRRWRHYAGFGGRQPTRDFLESLPEADRARLAAQMHRVAREGLRAARHLHGDIYEVRVLGSVAYRVLFAAEGRGARTLLALHAFAKTSQRTPRHHLDLAQRRLDTWRRGT